MQVSLGDGLFLIVEYCLPETEEVSNLLLAGLGGYPLDVNCSRHDERGEWSRCCRSEVRLSACGSQCVIKENVKIVLVERFYTFVVVLPLCWYWNINLGRVSYQLCTLRSLNPPHIS